MKKLILCSVMLFSVGAFARQPELPTASDVDVGRYVGKWYTIASLPQFFTRNCEGQTAEYAPNGEKTISVLNACIKENKEVKTIKGEGTIVDAPNNARLVIRFDSFWTNLFRVKGEYVIIKLSESYDTVMVGSTNRKSLWIMSRTPSIDPDVLLDYKKTADQLGFSVEQLKNAKY